VNAIPGYPLLSCSYLPSGLNVAAFYDVMRGRVEVVNEIIRSEGNLAVMLRFAFAFLLLLLTVFR